MTYDPQDYKHNPELQEAIEAINRESQKRREEWQRKFIISIIKIIIVLIMLSALAVFVAAGGMQ
jgi:hypothetical protein